MTLRERFRPMTLDEIKGQDEAVATLRSYAAEPAGRCLLLLGAGGNGKTSAARAFMREIGVSTEWPGLDIHNASRLGIEDWEEIMAHMACTMFCGGKPHYHGLIVEELERLTEQCVNFLKTALEVDLGERAVVIACSNDISALQAKDMFFLQRFVTVQFDGGEKFAEAANEHVRDVWNHESKDEMPERWMRWGWTGSNGSESFSLRCAFDRMERELLKRKAGVK